MTSSAVTYSHVISCPRCGHKFSGYLEVEPDKTGKAICPQCRSTIVQQLPADFVPQIPPEDYGDLAHPHIHHTHYPGLYSQPKQHPRFDFMDLFKILYSPAKAFSSLYLSTDLRRAMAIVLVFSMVSAGASMLISVDMADIVGYNVRDAVHLGFQVFLSWAMMILAFMVLSVLSASISKGIFEGRGERSATMTLIGYCFPAYVFVNVVVLLIFKLGFSGVAVELQDFTMSDLREVSAGLVVLVIAAIIGLIWLLVITSRAISVANDISQGEAALTAILSIAASGLIFLVVSAMVNLPLGLSF
jgi:hypothetical protein